MSAPATARLNPFPGLRPFTQDEDYLFFGREEQTLELLQRLGNQRFVAVVGSSGSGKSSLVRCGLLSELLGGRMLGAGSSWEIAVTHPGGNPLGILTEALLDADLYDRDEEHARENLMATLSRSHFGLVEAVKQAGLNQDTNFLLVVDQFEEIFRFNEAGQRQQEAANEFVSLLLEAASQKDVPIYVVLTMRSDFIGECGQFEGLAEMVNRGEFLIPRLTREQYKRVIEGPIKVAGGQIAPRLLQRLLNDLGQQADQLPCLQHALMRTWDVWAARGDAEALDLDDYQLVGKMTQALSLHADEIYAALASDRQRDLCRGIFQALTVEESNSRGIRRPQRLGRLCQILEVPSEELRPIIDAYRKSGVTFLMPAPDVPLSEPTIIDISHESLMRVWVRLRQWVEEETQAAGIYHRLSESADLHARGKAGLYRDPELGIALAWREAKRPNLAWAERYRPGFAAAIEFLEKSQQASVLEEQTREAARQHELEQAQQLAEVQQLRLDQQQRSADKLRKLIAGLAVVVVIAGVACVLALIANQRANRLAETARNNEASAKQSASRAERSQKETAQALADVATEKSKVEGSLAKAEAAERQARAAEEAGRKLLYTTDMRLAPFVWRDDRTTGEQLRSLLAKHVPTANATKSDLRGFEWHYYQHVFENSATVFPSVDVPLVAAAFDATGQPITLDEIGQVRRWSLSLQEEDVSGRHELPGASNAPTRVLSPDGQFVALINGNDVTVFDTATGQQKFQLKSPPQFSGRPLVFSRLGNRMVVIDDKIRWCNTADGQVLATLDRSFGRIEKLDLSPDGAVLAVIGHNSSGNLVSTFRLNGGSITPLAENFGMGGTVGTGALSPDGKRLLVGAALSGSMGVLDPATGNMIAYLPAHASNLAQIVISADGSRVVTADVEGTIKIWGDVQKLTPVSTAVQTLKGHRGPITSAAFSNDGQQLITTSEDKTARVWDLKTAGVAIRSLDSSTGSHAFVVRCSPTGQLIAAAAPNSSTVSVWDAGTGDVVRELTTQGAGACSVAFSPTDSRLLAVGYGGSNNVSHVLLWDIHTGTELARLPGATDIPGFLMTPNNGLVGALAFSPDGKYLVAGFGYRNMLMATESPSPLNVWDVATRRPIRRLSGHTGYCTSLEFSKDGALLASGSRDGTTILWSTRTWKPVHTLRNPDLDTIFKQTGRAGMVEAVAFSPDGKTLAQGSRERSIHLWNVETGKLVDTLTGHSGAVPAVTFAPDGRTLASGSHDNTVRLWNVETRGELMQLDSGSLRLGSVQSLMFSPDGQNLVASGDRTAFWSAAPVVWSDPVRGAEVLRSLLKSGADFQTHVRMLSGNLRMHSALERLDQSDPRVAAALAATQANWHASRANWPEAAAAFDRLVAADPQSPQDWLRTPGLLRLGTALLHQDRPRDAATLLTGGAPRRRNEGLLDVVDKLTVGMTYSLVNSEVVVRRVSLNSPAAKAGVRTGDVIEKVGNADLLKESMESFLKMLDGEAGSKVQLTVRRSGSEQTEVLELTREKFLNDPSTGEVLLPLRTALNDRLAREPAHPGLLELRAELAGQWSDSAGQIADYTAALEALGQQLGETAGPAMARLYARRGRAHSDLKQWSQAVDDFARVVTDATTDDELLTRQAEAKAEQLLSASRWTVLKPAEATSKKGTTLTILPDDSVLASGQNPLEETYRINGVAETDFTLTALRMEALTHDSLPKKGNGRTGWGSFGQTSFTVTVTPADGAAPTTLAFLDGWSDPPLYFPITQGQLNTSKIPVGNVTVVWPLEHPVTLAAGSKLAFEFSYKSWEGKAENAGRLRLSLSSDPAPVGREQLFLAANKLTQPWQRLAAAYRMHGDQPAVDHLAQRFPKHLAQFGDAFVLNAPRDWQRAVDLYSRGIADEKPDSALLTQRGRAYEALRNWEAAAADWSRVAAGNPEAPRILGEFARRLSTADQSALAIRQFEQTAVLHEQTLAVDPENDIAATDLSDVLLNLNENQQSTGWTVLEPASTTSKGSATLTTLPDRSVLASGANPDKDTYTFIARTDLPRIRAIRLEALADESLAKGGPGRSPSGNFALSHVTVRAEPVSGTGQPVTLKLVNPQADFEQVGYPVTASLDGDPNSAWSIDPQINQNHAAVYEVDPAQVVGFEGGTQLTVTLDFQFNNRFALGRFRLALSGDRAMTDAGTRRFAVRKVNDPWMKLAAAYALNGRHAEASRLFAKVLKQAGGYEDRKPILEMAAQLDDLLAPFVQQPPQDLQVQLAVARHHAVRGQRLLAATLPGEALAELENSRAAYTRLRSAAPESNWSVAKPTSVTSKGGETLTVENDGSVFVSGPNADRAVYTLTLPVSLASVSAIRVDSIPDPRLPSGGAGRYGNGNFHLAEFTAAIDSSPQPLPLEFSAAFTDASTSKLYDGSRTIDRDLKTYWDINAQSKLPHSAVFVLKSPVRTEGRPLRITLDSGITSWGQHGLGRFRVSVTGEPDAQTRAAVRMDFRPDELIDLNLALAKVHLQQGTVGEAMSFVGNALREAVRPAQRSRVIAEASGLPGVLETLADRESLDLTLELVLARELSVRGRKHLGENRLAEAVADLERSRTMLTRGRGAPQWSVLTPIAWQSTGGETLTLESDGSLFVSGPNPDRAEYTVTFRPDLPLCTAIRLETLPDMRLPESGTGRAHNGNFHLGELTARLVSGDAATPLEFSAAVGDTQTNDSGILNVLDGNPRTVWDIYPGMKERHWLVAGFKSAVRPADGVLSITLDSGLTQWPNHGLGRFRFLGTDEPAAVEMSRRRAEIPDSELLDIVLALAKARAQQGHPEEAAADLTPALELANDREGTRRIIAEAAGLPGVLQKLAEQAGRNALFQVELARYHAERGEASLAESVRLKARVLFEEQLQAEPRNTAVASDLANLLQEQFPERERIWIDDAPPAGANFEGSPAWEWVGLLNHQVFRGEKAMRRKADGVGQHYFTGASHRLKIGDGAKLFAYVYLDPEDLPRTLMLQFHTDNWEHRAYWGEDLIEWGTKGTPSHILMGPLPKAGEWVRLEVDAAKVNLPPGSELTGWSFAQHGGTCYWDAAGSTNSFSSVWQGLAGLYHHIGETERGLELLTKAGDAAGISAGLEPELMTDDFLEAAKESHPDLYTALLTGSAAQALGRGQLDQARDLYRRLAVLQPENPLWNERNKQLEQGVLGVWNFDAGPGTWTNPQHCTLTAQEGMLTVRSTGTDPRFESPVSGPRGRKGLVLRYRTAQDFNLQIFWADAKGGIHDDRHHDYAIPASSEWREVTLPFWCDDALQMVRLDPNVNREHALEIDSLLLRQLDPADYHRAATTMLVEPELARLTAAVTANPVSETYSARAMYLARIGRWSEAAEDVAQDRMTKPRDRIAWFREVTLRLMAGDLEAHAALCRAMAVQFPSPTDAGEADSLAKARLLRPDASTADLPIPVIQAAALEEGMHRDWMQGCCALIAYRQGFFEEAIGWSRKHVGDNKFQVGTLALVVRAMAEHRLGRPDARQTLAQVEAQIPAILRTLGKPDADGPLPAPAWHVDHDWLVVEILRREAVVLLEGPGAVPPGKPAR